MYFEHLFRKKVFTVRTMSHFLFLQHRLSCFIFFAFFISLTSTNSTLHFNLEHITLFFILNSGFSIFCRFFCAPRYAVNKIQSRKNRLLVVWVSFSISFKEKFGFLYDLLTLCTAYSSCVCIIYILASNWTNNFSGGSFGEERFQVVDRSVDNNVWTEKIKEERIDSSYTSTYYIQWPKLHAIHKDSTAAI